MSSFYDKIFLFFFIRFRLILLRRIKVGAKHVFPILFSMSIFIFLKYFLDDLISTHAGLEYYNFTHTKNINILYRIM